MKLLDANLPLYAYDLSSPFHEATRSWLEKTISRSEPVALTWVTILAFLRIATHPRVPRAGSVADALSALSDWLAHPAVSILQPGERHWSILSTLVPESQSRGPVIMDAHLAALAIEHGATLCTNDRDFARFPRLRTFNPLR